MNSFLYPVFYLRFDTRALPAAGPRLKAALKILSIQPRDYLLGDSDDLDARVRELLREHAGFEAEEITLLTLPRIFGYAFNPVSFWFCRVQGELRGALCEVNNTFGERHFYWVESQGPGEWVTVEKRFHVSPFLAVSGSYRFRFDDGPERTRVDIVHYSPAGERLLSTWLDLRARDLAEASWTGLLRRYGWLTILVVVRIHWQALRLVVKRAPFFAKPAPPAHRMSR